MTYIPWSGTRVLTPVSLPSKGSGLPSPPLPNVELVGLEPTASCLQNRRSS